MVLESLINSAAFVSLPLRHFEMEMELQRQRKKIKHHRTLERTLSSGEVPLIFQETEEGKRKRETISHNQNLLLSMISHFVEAYTDFIWVFYNLSKLQEVETAKLLDC